MYQFEDHGVIVLTRQTSLLLKNTITSQMEGRLPFLDSSGERLVFL